MAKRSLRNVGVSIVATIAVVIVCEAILWALGYPREYVEPVVHPAHHYETRRAPEYEYTFRTNADGLRYHRVSDRDRRVLPAILVVGDSFVEGFGVDESARFTDLLESRFALRGDTTLVVNGGIAGSGPARYKSVFDSIASRFKTRGLLIAVYANDVANSSPVERAPTNVAESVLRLGRFLRIRRTATAVESIAFRFRQRRRQQTTDFIRSVSREAERLGIPQDEIERWKNAIPQDLVAAVDRGEFNGSTMSYGLLHPDYWLDSIDVESTAARQNWTRMKETVESMLMDARRRGIEAAIMFIPTRLQVESGSHDADNPWIAGGVRVRPSWLSDTTRIQRLVSSLASDHNVPFLDLTPTMRESARAGNLLYYPLDGHWNSDGHRLAAQEIAAWLERERVYSDN